MSRADTVTKEVKYFHELLQEEINLPELSELSETTLRRLLDRIYRFETRCTVFKIILILLLNTDYNRFLLH